MIFHPELNESLTLKFAEAANERRNKGEKIISLGLGEPEFDVPSVIVKKTQEVLGKKRAGYSSPLGLPKLREMIAEKFVRENGIPAQTENIIITPGTKQAIQFVLMSLLEPQDEIIVLMPGFVSFIPQIYIAEPQAGVIEIDIDKNDFSIPLEQLKSRITPNTKAILLNTPNNPAGYIFSKEQLIELYNIAAENNIYIISDEIYEKLIFGAKSHFSIGSLETKVSRVITVGGFSKSLSMTGWRVGYACFPQELKEKLTKLQQHINTNTCTFIQDGLIEALPAVDYSYLTAYNDKLKGRVERLIKMVDANPNLSLVRPEGSFFAFINISRTKLDSNQFCSEIIKETGVALTPGVAFGKNWDDHVRISLATEDAIIDEGLQLINEFSLKF